MPLGNRSRTCSANPSPLTNSYSGHRQVIDQRRLGFVPPADLGWTRPRLRDPESADRWTWLLLAVHTQLRLARGLVTDLRRPWERPTEPARSTPARVRRGFRNAPNIARPAAVPNRRGRGQAALRARRTVLQRNASTSDSSWSLGRQTPEATMTFRAAHRRCHGRSIVRLNAASISSVFFAPPG